MQNKFRYLLHFLVIGLILLLNACSTVSKDGPPDYNVDETKIPDAVPKPEKLSKYGNYKSYYVRGHNYHVMSSSKNYEEVGIASWYGAKFHAHNTSSGERYDMLSMTAAHKTLPLPTYVLVTNLKNDKRIIVKVNDRGPFEGNRIIDLSYVAAKKLGMLGHGTALVDVKAIDPLHYNPTILANAQPKYTNNFDVAEDGDANNTEPTPPIIKHVMQHSRYAKLNKHHKSGVYLQVGAFKNKVYAERLQKRIHHFVHTQVSIASSKHLYKVRIGPFHDYATAKNITKKLKAAGLSSKQFTEV